MPAQYERMRDRLVAQGKPLSLAKRLAAMTYNARRGPGVPPVTNRSEVRAEGTLERIVRRASEGRSES